MKTINLALVAHVDHGKSSLSSALIEIFHNLQIVDHRFLDNLLVEKNKNITVRTQAINLLQSPKITINLLDTPGHVDFVSEMIKSLEVSDFIFLLVAINDGIQSQTLQYFKEANSRKLKIFWIISKMDRMSENNQLTSLIIELWKLQKTTILLLSTEFKNSIKFFKSFILNLKKKIELKNILKKNVYILGSFRENNVGYHLLIKNLGVSLKSGDTLKFCTENSNNDFKIRKLYQLRPMPLQTKILNREDIAYIVTSLKNPIKVGSFVGDKPKDGNWKTKHYCESMVIPVSNNDYMDLARNLHELSYNDFNLSISPRQNSVLGNGFLCRTTGNLHLEVVMARLEEMGSEVIVVDMGPEYKISLKNNQIWNPNDPLNENHILKVEEEIVSIEVEIGIDHLNNFLREVEYPYKNLKVGIRNAYLQMTVASYFLLNDFERLIKKCQGHISYNILSTNFQKIDYQIVDFYINDVSINLRKIFKNHDDKNVRNVLKNIVKGIRKQEIKINVQAKNGMKTIASEKLNSFRKNVTSKLKNSGDLSRKAKLLEAQKRGKKKLQQSTIVTFDRKLFVKRKKGI